jgi:hypothetical protein
MTARAGKGGSAATDRTFQRPRNAPGIAKAVIGALSFNDFALVRRAAREWRVKTE